MAPGMIEVHVHGVAGVEWIGLAGVGYIDASFRLEESSLRFHEIQSICIFMKKATLFRILRVKRVYWKTVIAFLIKPRPRTSLRFVCISV